MQLLDRLIEALHDVEDENVTISESLKELKQWIPANELCWHNWIAQQSATIDNAVEQVTELLQRPTVEHFMSKSNWGMMATSYEDKDYVVFKEKGVKEKETVWLHIHPNYTSVFINETQFLFTTSNLLRLEIFLDTVRN